MLHCTNCSSQRATLGPKWQLFWYDRCSGQSSTSWLDLRVWNIWGEEKKEDYTVIHNPYYFEVLYRRQLDFFFQFLEDVSALIQESSSVLTNWRGVCRLLNSVWECPYEVVEDSTWNYHDLDDWELSSTICIIHFSLYFKWVICKFF